MKRVHIHVAVAQLAENITFYTALFGTPPTTTHNDYAKWELHDPVLNFAISSRGHSAGVNHLGIQVDSDEELAALAQQFDDANIKSSAAEDAACCYARSNKYWTIDPQGIAWESFHTHSHQSSFGEDLASTQTNESSPCCIPLAGQQDDGEAARCCVENDSGASPCCG